MMETSSRT